MILTTMVIQKFQYDNKITSMMSFVYFLLLGCCLFYVSSMQSCTLVESFAIPRPIQSFSIHQRAQQKSAFIYASSTRNISTVTKLWEASSTTTPPEGNSSIRGNDPNEIIARRIIVKGNVQGGYYRACVLNEGGKFRRLTGTMSPPDDSDRAEIYVEGKRRQVEGFIRWCRKGNVGLSQITTVAEVSEEEPTGLYDGFYVKTK